MMAAFSRAIGGDVSTQVLHVVELDVGDGGHPAVPGVRGVEPAAEADLDDARRRRPARANHRNAAAVSDLELGRRAVRRLDAVRRRAAPRRRSAAKSVGRDGPAVDDDALAIADQVRLGRLADRDGPPRAARRRPCAWTLPLPLVPPMSAPRKACSGDRRAPRSSARVRPRPSADAEPAARLERRDGAAASRSRDGHGRLAGTGTTRPAGQRPVSSSS